MTKLLPRIEMILKNLSGKMEGFYLAGGTALAIYFHHRESYDLDFFTQDFSEKRINGVVKNLAESLGKKIKLMSSANVPSRAKIKVYSIDLSETNKIKLDFVEDVYPLVKDLKLVNGVPILSQEDIYKRKILTACGNYFIDEIGRENVLGGRQEARDFFDLFFLSTTFMPLSKFAIQFCDIAQRESIVIWFRSYDRTTIKTGLLDIITDKNIDYRLMEKHFANQVEELIRMAL